VKKVRSKKTDIDEKTLSIALFALQLEVGWLREKGWTDNEIRGLWSRLVDEYTRTSAQVRGRKRR
jgi:hypothetical protein